MSTALERRCLIFFVLLARLTAVVLSGTMYVGGCGCPISSNVLRIGTALLILKKTAPNSASADEAKTHFTIVLLLFMDKLLGGMGSWGCGWGRILVGIVLINKWSME